MHDERYRIFGRDGEFDHNAMRELIRRGEVTSLTDIALVGEEQWRAAGFYPDLTYYLGIAAQKQPRMGNAVATANATSGVQFLVVVLFVVAGVVCLIVSSRDLIWGLQSRNWPTAEATLIDSDVTTHLTRSRGRTRRHYTLTATYTFKVDGRRYVSRGVSFGTEWLRNARTDLVDIRNARPLRVYYDPSWPANAVLHNGVSSSTVLLTAIGIGAIAFGLLSLIAPAFVRKFGDRITAASRVRLGARS